MGLMRLLKILALHVAAASAAVEVQRKGRGLPRGLPLLCYDGNPRPDLEGRETFRQAKHIHKQSRALWRVHKLHSPNP